MDDGREPDRTDRASSWSSVSGDLRWSLQALRSAPVLPGLTGGLLFVDGLVRAVEGLRGAGAVPLLRLPLALFLIGFLGTQRVFFARRYQGRVLRFREVCPLTYAFVGRFLALGLLGCVPLLLLLFAFRVTVIGWPSGNHGSGARTGGVGRLSLVALGIGVDVALTFVVPILALSTRSVRAAIRQGVRMLVTTWPACAWYALAPGLTLTLLGVALPRSLVGTPGTLVLGVVGGLVGLWLKGAVVSFYLREVPNVGPDGSAYFPLSSP